MKKILVLLLSIILLFAVLPTVSVSAAKEPTFVVSNEKADAGDTVKITISTKNNPGIISMKLLIKYDNTALKLVNAEKGKFNDITFSPKGNIPFIANWVDGLNPNNKTNGVITTLTFEVLDTAPQGKSEISVTYNPDDVFEITKSNDLVNVKFAVQNGYVDITNPNVDNQASNNSSQSNSENTSQGTDNPSTSTNTESYDHDNTTSQLLEQIMNSSSGQESGIDNSQANTSVGGDNSGSQNGWIIWVVIGTIVVIVGAFAVVIIKGKKEK